MRRTEQGRTTNCWPARATSGCATRTACPDTQRATLESLHPISVISRLLRAYQIRLAFQELYEQSSTESGAAFLSGDGIFWATHTRLPPIIDAARAVGKKSLGRHSTAGSTARSPTVSSRRFNSLVQAAAKAKARGYRSIRNLTAMVYLLAGKLDLSLPY